MSLPPLLQLLQLPVIGAPMFIAGNPRLVIEQCKAGAEKKVWRDIWSAGQGVGQIDKVVPVAEVVAQLSREYLAARQRLSLSS